MKKLMFVVGLLALAGSAKAGEGTYFQHVTISQSGIQGDLMSGTMRTNAGVNTASIAPIFYHNDGIGAAWYDLSWSPLALGGYGSNGNASGDIGALADLGPQLEDGAIELVGLAKPAYAADIQSFLNCANKSACLALSAGPFLNLTLMKNGAISTTSHELFASPLGIFIGPSVLFGGPSPQ